MATYIDTDIEAAIVDILDEIIISGHEITCSDDASGAFSALDVASLVLSQLVGREV